MYKMISFYRSASSYYPATARIIQVSEAMYLLYIVHDRVGTVLFKKGPLPAIRYALFCFSPFGYGGRIIHWKKVQTNGN